MFKNAKIAVRLMFGFGSIIVLLILLGVFTRIEMGEIAGLTTALYEHPFTVSTNLIEAEADVIRMQKGIKDVLLSADSEELNSKAAEIDESEKAAYKHLAAVHKLYLGGKEDVEGVEKELEAWKLNRGKVISLMRSNKRAEALALHKGKGYQHISRVEEKMAVIKDFAAKKAESFVSGAKETAEKTYILIYAIVILAVLASSLIAYLITMPITGSLKSAVDAADRISSGDLSVTMPAEDRGDEVGMLTQSFSRMTDYLRNIAGGAEQISRGDLTGTVKLASDKDILGNAFAKMTSYLQEMAAVSKRAAAGDLTVSVKPLSDKDLLGNSFAEMIESLRSVNREIRDGVNVLAASASEILTSTTEVASGMSETTASVSETTATVEEVKQIAQMSAEKSRIVSDNAQKSVMVAQQGDAAVSRTVDGINNIRVLMESVAVSIVKLSEQTQAIGEIIAAVSDLAQQSNLLAVNAAIEASKAGEHGKGFTVVAQEIKSLADQSKQSTEQVRSILGDIQKATGASVLAAEQVSKAVDGGVKQASESGEAIRRLAENIAESAQAATQIAASSQQQFAGMDQISMAMESIKQAAQQNVTGTKQAEKAAHDLNELGQKLKAVVGKYKI